MTTDAQSSRSSDGIGTSECFKVVDVEEKAEIEGGEGSPLIREWIVLQLALQMEGVRLRGRFNTE